jgi:hypothetical protein
MQVRCALDNWNPLVKAYEFVEQNNARRFRIEPVSRPTGASIACLSFAAVRGLFF